MAIYLFSPVVGPTGGTELLQQFCYIARKYGFDARMFYQKNPDNSPIMNKFGFYNNPYETRFDDREGNSILIPEHYAEKALSVRHASVAIWWMSVDNYWGASYQPDGYSYKDLYRIARRFAYRPIHRRNIAAFKNLIHFYQCEYARIYLRETFSLKSNQLFSLSDYIDDRYHELAGIAKENLVLYNPNKGIKYTKRLIDADRSIKWVPLSGYSVTELVDIMRRAKVYIDFGAHPGKDRLPREAAACGCCILTGGRGAAANDVDIPIKDEFKIREFDVETALNKIHYLLDNYEKEYLKLASYRKRIASEKDVFEAEVCNAAELLRSM